MTLPQELVDQILINRGDIILAIQLKNNYVAKKIYNAKKHTLLWASREGHLELIKWLKGQT